MFKDKSKHRAVRIDNGRYALVDTSESIDKNDISKTFKYPASCFSIPLFGCILTLNEEFIRFTCGNEDITLSAGLAVVQPKYPISSAIELADRYLEMSKTAGKDRLTLFETTVKWSQIGLLLKCKDILNEGHENYSDVLTTRFIHRLLTYQQMYLDSRKGHIEKLIFHSHMNYDVKRNLRERIDSLEDETKKKWFEENILSLMLKLYQTPVDEVLMDNLRIPVSWTLYKNRKYRKGGES